MSNGDFNPDKAYHTGVGSVMNGTSREAHINALNHGFYVDIDVIMDHLVSVDKIELSEAAHRDFVLAQLAKITGEVGEAVSAIQHGDDVGFAEELADVVIRVFDLADYLNIKIGDEIVQKMARNKNRPYKHGKVC